MGIDIQEKVATTSGIFIKKASKTHRSIVVNILCESFENDPHMNWLLKKCNNPNKLKIMMNYLFDKTITIGEIYLTEDEKAVALWKSNKKEQFGLEYILRNLRFFIGIGLLSILRILANEKFTYNQYPVNIDYFHLYLIGVLQESQGKGYASKLINPILEKKEKEFISVYLETANINNVRIYEKKGFKVYNTWFKSGLELYYMKKS